MAKKKPAKKTAEKKASENVGNVTDSTNTGVTALTAAARCYTSLPVLLKVCRLCEATDGPFLNIFDADKVTAKKIDSLMPFKIAENDDLPHKICFRCSAKVEELFEFVQKCIKTQESLNKAMGNRRNFGKSKHRELWEEKLNQSNISNDDLCNAVIKKAMEGIKNFPLNPLPLTEEKAPEQKKSARKSATMKKEGETMTEGQEKNENKEVNNKNDAFTDKDDEPISSLKKSRKSEEVNDEEPPPKRVTRFSNEKKVDVSDNKPVKSVDIKETHISSKNGKCEQTSKEFESNLEEVNKGVGLKIRKSLQTNNFSLEATTNAESPKPKPKPFDVMENVSIIKVHGVGVLYQCNLCNRNFLKKDLIISHPCAKQGGVKVPPPKAYTPPEPPKIPHTVKYITMNVNKEVKKPGISVEKPKIIETKQPVSISESITLDDDDDDIPLNPPPTKKAKPRIGPASKVRRSDTNVTQVSSESSAQGVSNPHIPVNTPGNPTAIIPNITATVTSAGQSSVQFPTVPSLNSRYKLMPGPNNTFTLVEDKTLENVDRHVEQNVKTVPFTESNKTDPRYHNSTASATVPSPPVHTESPLSRPYPVGLIRAAGSMTSSASEPPTLSFPTPAMKKQSYTVVQTGNPSKLLISTKPQPQQPLEETSKKKSRKSKNAPNLNEPQKPPFTMNNAIPPANPGIFTLINVDPLLEPSYVLPVSNIIQESQISTSTNVPKQTTEDKEYKYKCDICNEKFSREKKLSAHVLSHYEKMDEEDLKRSNVKKRGKK